MSAEFITQLSIIGLCGLGIIVGSFLNVVILRYNTGKTIVKGRSYCLSCRTTLTSKDLFPILSFLFLKGRCRVCKTKISPQYILVEISTGLLFVLAYQVLAPVATLASIANFLFFLISICLLTVIVVYDTRHKIIPDAMVYTFILLSFIRALYLGSLFLYGGIIFFAVFGLFWLLSKGRLMGFGDAKLAAGIGFTLGAIQALSAIVISFWIGAVISVGLLIYQRMTSKSKHGLSMKSEIPFAPFLVLGMLVVFVYHVDVLQIGTLLQSM